MVVLPGNIGPVYFGLPTGLYALAGILFFLILYLIRPRPKKMEIPSLMFFIRRSGKSMVSSFLQTILRDLLFFLQLLIVLALLLIPSQPYTHTRLDIGAEHSVLVIDVSGSSQAKEGSGTRFEKAIDDALGLLGKKTSIILAKGTPEVLVRSAGQAEARRQLQSLKPTDTPSRLGEAMMLGAQALEGDGRVVLLSDFDNTHGVDVQTAKNALQTRGINVALVSTASKDADNIGVIDLVPGDDTSTVYIRNYKDTDAGITLRIGQTTKQLTIAAGGLEPVQFKTPAGVTELSIEPADDYAPDNKIWLSAPEQSTIKVLLITNDKSRFLSSALTSSKRIDLAVSEPPIIAKGDYDIYILAGIKPQDILPGTYKTLLDNAKNGASVIITAQPGLNNIDFGDLNPVVFTGGEGHDSYVILEQDTAITRDLELGNVKSYYTAYPRQGTLALARAADNNTLIAIRPEGGGTIVYYGIDEAASDFKLTPDYPIFWQNLLRTLSDSGDIRDMNKKAGETLTLDDTTAEGPDGKTLSGPLINLDVRGLYKVGGKTLAVNALDARESRVKAHPELEAAGGTADVDTITEERDFRWEGPLLLLATLFLLAELLFLKVRGDV